MADSLQSVALEGPREHGGQKSFSVLFLLFVFSPAVFYCFGQWISKLNVH